MRAAGAGLAGVLIMAGVAASAAHGADKNMRACSPLASAEIGAAVGRTVGQPLSTGCFAESEGMGISVGHNASSSVPMDKVKTPLDKAIGRLPEG